MYSSPLPQTGMEFKIRGCRLIPQHGFGLWEEGEQPRWAAFMPPEEGKSFKMGLLLDRQGMHFYNRELNSAFSIAHGSVVDWVANPHSFDNMSWGRTLRVLSFVFGQPYCSWITRWRERI